MIFYCYDGAGIAQIIMRTTTLAITIEAVKSKKELRTSVSFLPSLLEVKMSIDIIFILIAAILMIGDIIVVGGPVNKRDGDEVAEHLDGRRERNWKR